MKVSTQEERNKKRSLRLQKKLHVGKHDLSTYLIVGKYSGCENLNSEQFDDIFFERCDEIYEKMIAIGGCADGTFLSNYKMEIVAQVPSSIDCKVVVDVANSFEWLTEGIITKPKHAFHDPVWALDDFDNLDHWEVLEKLSNK